MFKPQQKLTQITSFYDFDVQDQVRDLQLGHKEIQMTQEFEVKFSQVFQTQTSQVYPDGNSQGHSIYWQEAQQQDQERKYQVEITKRLIEYSKDFTVNNSRLMDQSVTIQNGQCNNYLSHTNQLNILDEKKELNTIMKRYDNPTLMVNRTRKQDKRQKALEAMQLMIQKRQGSGNLKSEHFEGRMIKEYNEPIFTITNKSTLYSMMPHRKNRILQCNDILLSSQELNVREIQVKQNCLILATQEYDLQDLDILVTAISVFGPLLICQGLTMQNKQMEFLYKPGFEQQLQRSNLFESQLDFDYAEKPCINKNYKIFYRTTNSQHQLMVEKIKQLL